MIDAETETIAVRVHGRPAPKGSRIHGMTKTGNSFTRPASRYEKPWTEEIRRVTQVVMRHHDQPDKPYGIRLTFYLRKPLKNRREMPWWPTQHDLDKLARCVVDGLVQGGALADDRHVIALTTTKEQAENPKDEGVLAEIWTIAPPGGTP